MAATSRSSASGAGRGGLAAGITCIKNDLTHVIFEKDRLFASTLQTYPKGKLLLAEPPEVVNVGPLPVWDARKEDLLQRWHEELGKYPLDIRCAEEVRGIAPLADGAPGFVVTTSKGQYTSLKVVLATGTRGNPRQLRIPGWDSEKLDYVLIDPDAHHNHDCLVVGGGDSAVEAAIALATSNGGSNRVTISYRDSAFEKVKTRNREQLMALATAGRIALELETQPVEIRSETVVLERRDRTRVELPNYVVYVLIGADPPVKWLKEIGVKYVKKPENWSPGASDDMSFLELVRRGA